MPEISVIKRNYKVSERRKWKPRKHRVSLGYRQPNNDQSSHNSYSKLVTKTTHVLLRMASLYWEPWLWTRGSLYDAATHAGRCSSSIMRHFITERQPWHQSSLRATFRTEGLPLLDSCGENLLLLLLSQNFFLWRYKLPARSKWTSVSFKLPYIHLLPRVCCGGLKKGARFYWDARRTTARTDRRTELGIKLLWSLRNYSVW